MYNTYFNLIQCSDEFELQHMPIYGRNVSEYELKDAVNKSTVVTVCGSVGVGKSALVSNILFSLEKDGYCILYADMTKLTNMSALITYLDSKCSCSSCARCVLNRFKGPFQVTSFEERLSQWGRTQKLNTILFIDNLRVIGVRNKVLDTGLSEMIIKPLISGKLSSSVKVVITSHHCFRFEGPRHKIINLSGIDDDSCAQWIHTEYPSVISYSKGKQLCHSLGGFPLAVKHTVLALGDSHSILDIDNVISNLNSVEYGHSMSFFGDITKNREDTNLVTTLCLVYDSLEMDTRRCLFLLAEIPSDTISHQYIVKYFKEEVKGFADKCLRDLLSLSFIERVKPYQNYHFHSFIKNFVQWLGPPKSDQSLRTMMKNYWGSYVQHHIDQYRKRLKDADLQLAVDIGSNKNLVNNLFPLVDKKFNFTPLFEHALRIIDKQCCHNDSESCFEGKNVSDIILAYSYLTKAVYCPSLHPVSLLMEHKNKGSPRFDDSCTECSKRLRHCHNQFKIYVRGSNSGTAEAAAFGYYNALLINSVCENDTIHWNTWLYDLAMIVTTANSQCERYCREKELCSCGEQSSVEDSLYNLLLHKYELSHQSLERKPIKTNNYNCEVVLKIVVIIIQQHATSKLGTNPLFSEDIGTIIDQINPTCYLGITSDIILPFLKDYKNITTDITQKVSRLTKKHRELIANHQSSSVDSKFYDHPLFRYSHFFGLTALTTKELQSQWAEKVELSDERENWVCSIIKDKTEKCRDSFQLPLQSQVTIEISKMNNKIFASLRQIMEDTEFSEWKEIQTPYFYYLMSI